MKGNSVSIAWLIVLLALPCTGTIMARTWRVDVDGTGDAPTIQAAIDSSSAGDTILVGPGTYTPSVPPLIQEKDSLVVLGEAGPRNTILNGIALILATHITISGFTFESQDCGLTLEWSHHLLVEDNIIRGAARVGVFADVSSQIILKDNVIYACSTGLNFVDASDNVEISGTTISHCAKWGIYTDASRISISNSIISFNDVGVSADAPDFYCNDVYGNRIDYDLLFGSDPTGSNGNISVPPLFCGVQPQQSGNYYLRSISPCAPGNHPDGYSCGLIGRYGIGCENTTVRQSSWGRIKSMFNRSR